MLHNVTPHVSISLATTAESAASSLFDSYEHPVSSLPSTDAESTACGSHHIAPESGNFLYNVLSLFKKKVDGAICTLWLRHIYMLRHINIISIWQNIHLI